VIGAIENGEKMEIVNLKTAVTLRIDLGRIVAFSTKTLYGECMTQGSSRRPSDHVDYKVKAIVIDSADPWFDLPTALRVDLLWSNVLSVQQEPEKPAPTVR
jgi:hypothetical protein